MPGITHWQHPSFFAFFPASATGPAILGDLLASGLGIQGMLWATSPAATELETHMMDWLAELLDLPTGFRSGSAGGGVIQHSAFGRGAGGIAGRDPSGQRRGQ
jgi:aromatic-L-amino-acid decarboxylase